MPYQRAEWLDQNTVLAVSCEENVCSVLWLNAMYPTEFREVPTEPGVAFEISEEGEVVVLVDDETISIDQQKIRLNLHSPIRSLRWLPSLFWKG